MTCIAAIVEKGKVFMAADSAGTDSSWGQNIRADAKMFQLGDDMLVGFCGSFRVRDLLKYKLTGVRFDPKHTPDVAQFMATDFIDSVRQVLKDGGVCNQCDGVETFPAELLVAYKGRLFSVESDFQVGEQSAPFHAIGSGSDIAQGSLHSTQGLKLTPKKRLDRAMTASERYNAGVRAPFMFAVLG